MNHMCNYCSEEGHYRKRLIDNYHFSPTIKITYKEIWVCEKDKCFDHFMVDMNDDKILLLNIRKEILQSKL